VRILAITNLYPWSGQELLAPYNKQQFGFLSRDHELMLIAPVPWTEKVKGWCRLKRTPRGFVNEHGMRIYRPTYYFTPRVLQHRYGQFYLRSIRKLACHLVDEFQPEVILSSWAHPDGWAAVQVGRRFGVPAVIKVHGSDVLVAIRNRRRRLRIIEALTGADAVVAVSQSLAEKVSELGVEPNKVHVIYHGTDEALFSPGDQGEARARLGLPANRKMLLFVGNLLLTKGAGLLIEACSRLRQRGLDVSCYLVGRGADMGRLRALMARERLEDRVVLPGGCPQTALGDWYRACDLLVLPSFSEGIPNVLREGLLCGKPFVASRVGGIPELAHPSFSRLVPPGSAEALADAILEVLPALPKVERSMLRGKIISWEESAHLLEARLEAVCRVTGDRKPALEREGAPR
jgi:glycosyltransferase involved in cell wall biosynthesis